MGYRTYIAEMPKREYNKIRSMNSEQLIHFYQIKKEDDIDEDESLYKGVYDYGDTLHEFGKYTGFNPPKKSLKPFFRNKHLMSHYSEYDFYVVTPEFLIYVIEGYKERVKSYYSKMMSPFFEKRWDTKSEWLKTIKSDLDESLEYRYTFDFSKITQEEQNQLFQMIEHVKSMWLEWSSNTIAPVDTNLEKRSISGSWKYEYAIFELTHILKSFDWKKKVMIYYGY